MLRALEAWTAPVARAPWLAALASAVLLASCSGNFSMSDLLPGSTSAPSQQSTSIGSGQVKVGLILPLSGTGNAAVAAQAMRNAAEMALAEFNSPDIQLLVKDDGGSAPGAQQGAQQALDEGAEIILGPLFALTVGPVGQLARGRGVPVIAFSTDTNVAARAVYLLSFLPESDVGRIIGYAAGQGRGRSLRLFRTTPTVPWSRPPSSRRSRAEAGASWRSSATLSIAKKCRHQYAMWHRQRAGPMPSSSRTAPTPCRRLCRCSTPAESTPSASSPWGPGFGKMHSCSRTLSSRGPGMRAPNSTGFRNFSAALPYPIWPGSVAHRFARL